MSIVSKTSNLFTTQITCFTYLYAMRFPQLISESGWAHSHHLLKGFAKMERIRISDGMSDFVNSERVISKQLFGHINTVIQDKL